MTTINAQRHQIGGQFSLDNLFNRISSHFIVALLAKKKKKKMDSAYYFLWNEKAET